jgi:hypothetical protein
MSNITTHQALLVPQVMVSSTFTDLQEHRATLLLKLLCGKCSLTKRFVSEAYQ